MTIEWGGLNLQSTATSQVLDPGQLPSTVIAANVPFRVRLNWTVPPGLAPFLGGQFRLRAFAESVGPGPEIPIGQLVINVVPGQTAYNNQDINVPAFTLLGEGEIDPTSGQPVSGMYRIGTVLQHMNPGETQGCGFTDEALVQIRRP
jgi:hypothetical protein